MADGIENYFKLDRPLIVFSLATTGLALSMDRIVKLAYIKVLPNGRQIGSVQLFNPGMPIPPEATEIHGLTDGLVINAPLFADKAKELWEVFNNCCYSGFDITKLDLPLLRREFIRCGLDFNYQPEQILDTRTIYSFFEPRTIATTFQEYCQGIFENDHEPEAEVKASLAIFTAQLKKYGQEAVIHAPVHGYQEEPETTERKFYWRQGEPYFAFSRFKHTPVTEVARQHRGFLEWMLTADFSTRVKNIIKLTLRKSKTE